MQTGIGEEYTLKYQNDSDGSTIYQNTNYILLNLPMSLTDEQSEITYEAGPYFIQKEMPITTYNLRSSIDNINKNLESFKDICYIDPKTGKVFIDFIKLANLQNMINEKLKDSDISVKQVKAKIDGNFKAGDGKLTFQMHTADSNILYAFDGRGKDLPSWLCLGFSSKSNAQLVATRTVKISV